MGMLKEFKDFAVKGNVMDMAVGVIFGGAFNKIITSLVENVIMPPIGLAMGGVDFSDMKITLKQAQAAIMEGEAVVVEATEAVTVNYGLFAMTVIDFVILAFIIFMMVKGLNAAKKAEAAAPAAPAAPSKEEVLLGEIRDLLKK